MGLRLKENMRYLLQICSFREFLQELVGGRCFYLQLCCRAQSWITANKLRVLLCHSAAPSYSTKYFPATEWRLSHSLLRELQMLILHATPRLLVRARHMTHGARLQTSLLSGCQLQRGAERLFSSSGLTSMPNQRVDIVLYAASYASYTSSWAR